MGDTGAKLTRSAGFLQHDYLPLGALRPERVVYTALPEIVLSSAIVPGETNVLVTIDGQQNVTVVADVVCVYGKIVARGCNVKIVARKLIFRGTDPGIVTDGAPGAEPTTTDAPVKRPRAKDGASGEIIPLIREKNGEAGEPGGSREGTAAKDGANGDAGTDAGDIEIDVEEWVGDAVLSAVGGDGRPGQDGEDGQDGGNGGDGLDLWNADGEPGSPHETHYLVSPGPGGRGGDAGRGGAGGAGGDAGQITVRTICALPAGVTIVARGGARGKDGNNGTGGLGGLEGKNGNSDLIDPVALELTGGSGELGTGSRVGFRTHETAVSDQNLLGAFGDRTECYYWTAVGDQKQGWRVERADGSGDGKIRYGDRVVLWNLGYDKQRLVHTTESMFEKDFWLTTAEVADGWWVFDPVPPASIGQVVNFGDRVVLRNQDGRSVSAAPPGYQYWFPTLANAPPPRVRAENGKVHDKPTGPDPWTENKAGEEKAPMRARITATELAASWRPAQAWLQVERLKGQYLTLELGGDPYKEFEAELLRWQSLFTAVTSTPTPTPSTCEALERDELLGAAGKVNNMIGTYAAGQDYFGNPRDYAPDPSFKFYSAQVGERLEALEKLETKYLAMLASATKQDEFKANAAAVFNEAVMTGTAAVEQRKSAIEELFALQKALDDASREVNALKEPLRTTADDVVAFQKDVQSAFGCDLISFLQGLEMMLFVPPVKAKEGAEGKPFGFSGAGAVMAGAQLAKFIKNGVDTIKTADGEMLEKKMIVTSVNRLGMDVLASAQQIWKDEQGRAYDLGGPGILATLDEWEELVAKFIDRESAVTLRRDIRRLADAVRARGKAVIDFNDKLFEVLTLSAIVADRDETRAKSLKAAAELNNPALPAVLGFLARQYAEKKDAAIESLYLANRAYAYWRLDDGTEAPTHDKKAHRLNVFRETLVAKNSWERARGDVYSAIDTAILDTCKSTLNDWFETDLAAYAAFPQPFPEVPGSDGLRILIRDRAVLDEFRALRAHGLGPKAHRATITITDHGKNGTFTNEHLRGLADVRLTAFRVFLNGAFREQGHSDTLIQVQFQHDSSDQNFTEKGERRSFTRPSLPVRTFIYDGGQDAVRYVAGNPGKFTAGYIKMDGSIGCGGTADELARAGDLAKFAGVGPFSTWTLVVDPQTNPGLVLGPDLEIEIQMCGVARTRTR